jgi:hypothetical protein
MFFRDEHFELNSEVLIAKNYKTTKNMIRSHIQIRKEHAGSGSDQGKKFEMRIQIHNIGTDVNVNNFKLIFCGILKSGIRLQIRSMDQHRVTIPY